MTLTLIGLGNEGHASLTFGAVDALRNASGPRLAWTRQHPAMVWLVSAEIGIVFKTFFDESNLTELEITAQILKLAETTDVLYAVPGHPLHDHVSCLHLIEVVREKGIAIQVFSPGEQTQSQQFFDFGSLVSVMSRLRDPERGCPWDREQTLQTLKRFTIEEAYEVVEAIESDDPNKLREELGDLLLQVVFQTQLENEVGHFDIRDVSESIVSKLIRRHPHVFGSVQVNGSDQVLENWAQIKSREKGYEDRTSILDGIPPGLPALMRALEVSKRVVKVGFEWPEIDLVLDKVEEEIAEMRAEIAAGETKRAGEELGDLLFTLVNVARQLKVDPEDALRQMTLRFATRFRYIEAHAAAQGRAVQDLSLAEMDAVWDAAKREESQ